MHSPELFLLFFRQFWSFPSQLSFRLCDRHALAGAHPDEVGLELGEGGNDVEEHFPHWVSGIMDCRAESELCALPLQLLGNVARIRNGAGQAIQFRHDQRVALAERGKRLIEAGSVPAGSGQTMVRVDPILGHTQLEQGFALRFEILGVGRAASVSDPDRHGRTVRKGPRHCNFHRTRQLRRVSALFRGAGNPA